MHRLGIEELTQFSAEEVDEMESCCRSSHDFIRAMKIYTTNPGKRGHKWVKEKFIDPCKALPDGDPRYLEQYDLTFQPLKSNKPHVTASGETFVFIPSLVFDNEHLSEKDENYVRNLMNKNEILRRMWLFGDWDVFAGQFFDIWDERVHMMDEKEFYKANSEVDLIGKRMRYDWSDYRLYCSNDYGFAESSAWACGFYAVDMDNDVYKIGEIVRSGLTITEQARETKKFLKKRYSLDINDFEMVIADPKSYWQRQDKGTEFWTFERAYQDEGITLTKGINDREAGAMAVMELLYIRKSGLPQMRVLSCCEDTCQSIPLLPASKKNPNDVDTTVFDHPYDETRYFAMMIRGDSPKDEKKKKRTWRDKMRERMTGVYEGRPKSWKAA
jgi:hypothetical protein